MKLQNLTVIFIIIVLPIIILLSFYISTGLKTIEYKAAYDEGLLNATYDAVYAFEKNTANNKLSDNPEIKRDILKSSIKMFEKSLCFTCNISSYNTDEIEEYIPAIVFGMYDGFYMYAPSYNPDASKNEHELKNYVYYSEKLDNAGTTIIYSLDNYVAVSGDFGDGYEIKSGYLIVEDRWKNYIDTNVTEAKKYYEEAKEFTDWFLNEANLDSRANYLKISTSNDPEDENSLFVQHKRKVIKEKIEGVLNSSITSYSERTHGYNYKMPKLSEDDWQRIYSNISMITFFQGKNIGLTKYNGYCALNITNSNEYVNPNLMYFTDGNGFNGWYHDIRCTSDEFKDASTLKGYKIGDFRKKQVEETDANGNITTKYVYDHDELACYECVNGQISSDKSVYEYINGTGTQYAANKIKKAYYTSLARERYNTTKITQLNEIEQNGEIRVADVQNQVLSTTTNTEVYDEYGNKIIVPAGFKITTDARNVTEGIVIEDATGAATNGSQFVWIPIGEVKYKESGANKTATIRLSRYDFANGTSDKDAAGNLLEKGTPIDKGSNIIDDYYQELATSDKGNATALNISGFISSATSNGGYYLARYEARTATARINGNNALTQVTCKSSNYIYNYVTQNQASSLSRNMYGTNGNITSDLINSYAWDTAIVFIQTFDDPDYSYQGSPNTSFITVGGTSVDRVCNIYDMAGNCSEWSTETYYRTSSSNGYTVRGYFYADWYATSDLSTYGYTANYRSSNNNVSQKTSFRPLLYIN